MEANLTCIACGAQISCEPEGDCWCKHEAVRLPMPGPEEPAGCYCRTCLRAKAAAADAATAKA